MKKILVGLTTFAALTLFAGAASAATTYYVDPTGSDSNACTSTGTSACATVQGAVNKAAAGDTIDVAAGTYSGNIIIPSGLNNLTIQATGAVTFNLGSGYGVNLDNGYPVTGLTLNGFTFNSTSGTTYALKAYQANGLSLSNDVFDGNTFGGGVDINTTSNVTLSGVTAENFHKNGFAVTSAYTMGDESTPSSNITFNNITSSGNGWAGIAFYTVGNDHSPTSTGGSASMTGIQFTGTNTLSNNGTGGVTQGGIFIEGDSDANVGSGATPANTVTTDGTTLNLDTVAFSGNSAFDIINYQTAPVTAYDATFGGLTGDQMNSSQQSAENSKIYDQMDNSHLGLVSYYHAPSVTTNTATNVTSSDATMNATNGPVAAGMESFWVSTSTIDTSSANIPAGVYSTPTLPGVGAGSTFQDQLSEVTTHGIVTGGNPGNMPAITPGTTYNYVAWVNVGGTWYPGNQQSVTILVPVTPTVTTNSATGETTSGATLNGTNGSVNADETSFWWGTSPLSGLTPGGNVAEFPATGWMHDSGLGAATAGSSFSENVTSLTPGQTYYFVAWVEVGGTWYPGQVLSFVVPMTMGMCPANLVPSTSALETVNVNSNSSTPTASINTLVNGQTYLLEASNTWQNSSLNVADAMYSSLNSWTNYQEGYDTAPYWLGPDEFNLEINGAFANWGPYSSSHNYTYTYTGTGSPVNFMVFDGNSNNGTSGVNSSWYGDNTGSLSVSIYQCVPPAPPANACATPNSAPAGYTLVKGTTANESIMLPPNTMFVSKGNGNNTIKGADGNYIVCTGSGNDTITLGNGSDTITDTGGNNVIKVGNGSENITTGSGNDTITTGNGGTTAISAGGGNNVVKTGTGSYTITAGSGNDTITTQSTGNSINAGSGNNTVHQL